MSSGSRGGREAIPLTVAWHRGAVRLIDQKALPGRLRFVDCATVAELVARIRDLTVRGAPAIGAAGAYGVALAACTEATPARVRAAAARLRAARPTAVNLMWGVDRVLDAYEAGGADAALAEAHRVAEEDVEHNRRLGAFGAVFVPDSGRVLTHCNAGHLATVAYGTAGGVIRARREAGKEPSVWVDETRPVLQGARLTAWELIREGIPATVIADGAAASLMAAGEVDVVVVGADRIAANGDVANKVGTYGLAVLAKHHGIPFVVAAPTSTIDVGTPTGAHIPIEERDPDEVRMLAGTYVTPRHVAARNPAFDVTPARLVSAIVTELGVVERPTAARVRRLLGR